MARWEVTVDYTGFEHAFGGDFGSRLRAVTADPDCFDESDCESVPVESVNDPVAGTVTASVPLAAGGTVMMLTAGADGPNGDWAATSLSASGEWAHGGSSGDFTWSYPMRTPDMPGGLGPELGLGYASGSVDGRTTSTNNQTSWVGEGFELSPGFIERRYVGCADDMGSGANNTVKTGDLCWKSDNATMSLGGASTVLVKDSSSGVWRPEADDGTRVERLTGAGNGARNGEYWRVTTTDGMQYYFGRHKRYSGDTASTNSVLTVPVAGNHAGEPCRASAFKDSFCDQAYRWLLDYVVDTNGNTMTYFYTRESNRYGQNLNEKSVSYHRGAYLTRVEYGQRQGSEDSTPAPARVVFTTAERCIPGGGVTCDPGELTSSTAESWPDVPFDQICTSSTSCSDRVSPTFFTRKRLTRVETQVRVSGSYQAVDRWTLSHEFPDPGDGGSAALWLKSVQHSGRAGTAVSLPAVKFHGIQLPNRVDGIDDAPPLNRYRMKVVETETGAAIAVNYLAAECTPSTTPSPQSNTKRCYPVYWHYEGSGDPRVHWFHKHPVASVIETDTTGDGLDVEHHYSYGSPGWAYDDDEFTKADHRTWSQWRGHAKVTTRVGHPSTDQLRSEVLYFRGLHGDRAGPSGGTKSVDVTDSWGDAVTDRREFQGMVREERVFNGSSVVTSTVHDPWRSAVTADDGKRTARIVDVGASREHTKLSSGWRTTEVQYTYDSHGLVTQINDRGDIATTGDDLCTRIEYAKNTSAWILDAVKRTETVSRRCTVSPSRPADVVSDERFFYDGGAYGAAPSKGNVTKTEVLDSWSGGPVYVTTSRASFDAHGRVTSSWDALDRRTTTAYTPASGGPVTRLVVTNPAGHVTTTTVDARLGVPTRVTDANGRHTDARYDALGRLTKVWLTDRDTTQTPSLEYAYRVAADKPVAVTSKTLLPDGAQAASVELFDSLLRPRQSQAPAHGVGAGGRIVSLTEYDSRGLPVESGGPFYATGAPSLSLVNPVTTVPRRVVSAYDGAGRVTVERLMVHQVEHSRRTIAYAGDRVHVSPPSGGTASTTVTDGRGRTVELREYLGGIPSGAFEATSYSYTAAGGLASMTDAAGNMWSWAYDLRGRRVQAVDPDAGISTTIYDVASQVVASTDARGETLIYTYDVLGRKTQSRDGSASGPVLAEWTYDSIEKGYLSSSTRYVDGQAYTTTVYGYDHGYRSAGETVSIPASEGALAGDYVTLRTHHADGSVNLVWHPGRAGLPTDTLRYRYTDTGLPEWMSGARTYMASTSYSPFGEVEQYSLGPNLGRANWQTFFYEEGTRRLSGVRVDRENVDPVDVDRTYSYDPAGNPVEIADTGGGASDIQCFMFDHLRRVSEAWSQTTAGCASSPSSSVVGGVAPYWQSYSYDAAGNRTELVEHGVGGAPDMVTGYAYSGVGGSGPHAVTESVSQTGAAPAVSTTYGYDQAGNTTTITGPGGATSYGWDAEGRLTEISGPDGAGAAVYSADGDRLIRRTPTATTVYTGAEEYTLDHGTGAVSGVRYYTLGGATLVMRDSTGTITSLAADVQGTPLAAVTDQNAITRRWVDPFGTPRGSIPLSWPSDRGFHTGTTDSWAGLVHMGARPYHPELGRFLAVDPLLNPTDSQQVNGYAYANNNPLAFADPSGLILCQVQGGCLDGHGGYQTKKDPGSRRFQGPGTHNGTTSGGGGGGGGGGGTSTPAGQLGGQTTTTTTCGHPHNPRCRTAGDSGVDETASGWITTVSHFTSTVVGESWRRGSNFAAYGVRTAHRRSGNPLKTMQDLLTGTAFVEDAAALYGIAAGGEIIHGYCTDGATCIAGVPTPEKAITLGRTVLFERGTPAEDMIAHEMTHVDDETTIGFLPFAVLYAGDYLGGLMSGLSHDEAYRDIWFEQRAYYVSDNYPDATVPGLLGGDSPRASFR